jgi:hypothetical protein
MRNHGIKSAVIIIFTCVLTPSISTAQSTTYFTPAISIGAVYDDNVFFASDQETSDYMGRVSPELAAGYESERMVFEGLYTFDAEYYADNSQLNDAMIRQHALANLQYELSRLLRFSLDSRFDATETPGELILQTGTDAGRNNAYRFSIGPALDYQITPRTGLGLGYTFSHEKTSGELRGDTHSARTGVDWQVNQNNSVNLYYIFNHYVFNYYLFDTTATSDSHVPMLGWTHNFSPRSSITLAAGPRFTDGSASPEIALSAQHTLARGELFAAYEKTESTVIGQFGTVENDTISAGIDYAVTPDLDFRMMPVFSMLEQSGVKVDVYQLSLELAYWMNDAISIIGSYEFSLQDGTLDALVMDNIQRNVFMLSIKFSMPRRGDRPRSRLTR